MPANASLQMAAALIAGALLFVSGSSSRADGGTDSPSVDGQVTGSESLAALDLSCPNCNVILLNIELLRADHVGLLSGSTDSATPNIDSFFGRSIVFEQASAPAGESYRSNLAVQTAMHAFHYDADQSVIDKFAKRGAKALPPEEARKMVAMLTRYPTMAEVLKENGYHTVSLNQGIRAGERLLLDRGFDQAIEWGRRNTSFRDTVADLGKRLSTADGKSFILYRPEGLHPYPYYYPPDRPRVIQENKILYKYRPRFGRFNVTFNVALPQPEQRKIHRLIYRQQLKYIDEELGKVFGLIKKEQLNRSSVIVLYANHGSGLGDNGVHRLAVSYQSCIHVPLIIYHPKITRQIRVSDPVALIDLAPTIYEIVGASNIPQSDGHSLIRDDSTNKTDLIGRNDIDEYIRMDNMKLIIKNAVQRELYDLRVDPHENDNLIDSLPSVARRLEAILLARKIQLLQNAPERH
ncbi:MAG: sulfatase-like hydrolase/transferase [Gammaproteobacteria bacterium]|nr:sulfatase-like hydrolase/transferase [Gammaproteobacteria bacterium]MDH3464348.1 sulfatase-like hydrolase/transferase [Gammaproteobacteria bacterium]